MQLERLYKVRDLLMERYDVPEVTAEYAARLYPYLSAYPYGISPNIARFMLERSLRHTKEHFARLREKNVFEMIQNGAWRFREEVKVELDACH